jgi:hypothetical protein
MENVLTIALMDILLQLENALHVKLKIVNYVLQIPRFVMNVPLIHHYLMESVYQIVLVVTSALKEDARNVILNVLNVKITITVLSANLNSN